MILPALITAGILGTLFLTRETEPSPSALDAEMERYGRLIVAGRAGEIEPGQLDSLAAHLRKANRTVEAATVEGWAVYVRAIRRGVQPPGLPAGLPGTGALPQLPPATESPLQDTRPRRPPSRISREQQLQLQQVLASLPPPFARTADSMVRPITRDLFPYAGAEIDTDQLVAFANQIDAALPGRPEPAQLRMLATQILGVVEPTGAEMPLPPPLTARASSLLAMGAAASPFALESLANEIDTMSPGHMVVNALRRQADMNRGLGTPPVQESPPVQGRPHSYGYGYARTGQTPGPRGPAGMFAAFAPFAPYVTPFVHPPFVNVHAPAPSAPPCPPMPRPSSVTPTSFVPESTDPVRRRMRCTDPNGCSLYRTPGSLYPTGASVPSMTVAYVEREEGPWVYVRFGTQQGWAPRASFSTDPYGSAPGAPSSVVPLPVQNFQNPFPTRM